MGIYRLTENPVPEAVDKLKDNLPVNPTAEYGIKTTVLKQRKSSQTTRDKYLNDEKEIVLCIARWGI